MEVWDIADQYFQDHPSASPPKVVVGSADRRQQPHGVSRDNDEDVENQLLKSNKWQGNGDSLVLRHSHNPKPTVGRILMGTVLLALIVLVVLKLISLG